jgi:hypothetical protein
MSFAASHVHDRTNGFAIAACIVMLSAVVYGVWQAIFLWRERRIDAFDIYFGKMWSFYDCEQTAEIYFRENPMPIWSLFDRDWFTKRKLPNIEEVASKAKKKSLETIADGAVVEEQTKLNDPSERAGFTPDSVDSVRMGSTEEILDQKGGVISALSFRKSLSMARDIAFLAAIYAYFAGFTYFYFWKYDLGIPVSVADEPPFHMFVYAFQTFNSH